MQSKLKELLDKYIAEYDELREEYENLKTRKQLFKELMNYFNSGFDSIIDGKIIIDVLLDSIYHDDIYKKEFYKLLYKLINRTYDAESELQNFSGIIDKDYYILNQRLLTLESRMNRIRKTVNSARVARIAIRVKNPIEANKYTLRDIEKIINYYELSGEITSKEAILCLNDLEFYNRNLTSETMQNKKEEEFAKEQYNNVPNILNAGYEVIEEPEVIIQRKEFLDKTVNEAINTLRYANKKEDIVRILENYERYDLENNEYNYIIIKVLNNISNELISYYNLLLEKDTYSFRRNRREIIEDYYMELNKYLIIRDYYDKCNEVIIDEENTTLTDEEEKELQAEKKLIFSASLVNPTKAKIIGDMDNVPYEYYNTALELINNFISGKNASGEVKHLKKDGNSVGFMELRSDQVRIVFKHIKNNIYNVVGVFTKKANNDMTMYQTMANRMIPDVTTEEKLNKQLELGEITLKQLTNLVEVKSRKGTR